MIDEEAIYGGMMICSRCENMRLAADVGMDCNWCIAYGAEAEEEPSMECECFIGVVDLEVYGV